LNLYFVDDNCPMRYDDGRNPYLEIEDFQFYYADGISKYRNNAIILNICLLISVIYFIY
jgi:hypothetical protein